MNDIKAVGFDLFNTLITVSPECVTEAMVRLMPIRLTQKGALGYDSAHVRIPPDPVRISESFS